MDKRRFVRVVPKVVALNPVAVAVAREGLLRLAREFRLELYGLQEGQEIPGQAQEVATLLVVAIRLQELRGLSEGVAVMAGAMSALTQCAERGFRWRVSDAVAVEYGVDIAARIAAKAKPRELRDAWAHTLVAGST